MLNALYGKFATSLNARSKIPYLDGDIVKYRFGEWETKKGLYIPIGCFITAYARNKTIRTSQAIRDYSLKKYGVDKYIYSDTDSCHTTLTKEELQEFLEIDDYKLGFWKVESSFLKGKFIRQKTYIEKMILRCDFSKFRKSKNRKITNFKLQKGTKFYTEINITCAGLPSRCYDFVTFENFKEGFKCNGKLTFSHVKGGVKLVDSEFTIKDSKVKKSIEKMNK